MSSSSQGMEHVDLEQENNAPKRTSPSGAVRLKRSRRMPRTRHVSFGREKTFPRIVLEKMEFSLS